MLQLVFHLVVFCSGALAGQVAVAPKVAKRKPAQIVQLADKCGTTHLTQWSVDLANGKLKSLRHVDFADEYCEPVPGPPGTANAVAVFMNQAKQVLWTREIMVPVIQSVEQFAGKRIAGGARPMNNSVLQIKIPWNETTQKARWIQLLLYDGRELGLAAVQ